MLKSAFSFRTVGSNGGVAPERAESLGGAGPENELVVEGCDGGSDERPNPEHPLQRPGPLTFVRILMHKINILVDII